MIRKGLEIGESDYKQQYKGILWDVGTVLYSVCGGGNKNLFMY